MGGVSHLGMWWKLAQSVTQAEREMAATKAKAASKRNVAIQTVVSYKHGQCPGPWLQRVLQALTCKDRLHTQHLC